MYFLIPKNAKFIYFKSSLCISILLLCLTPVIGSMLQTRVHSTQYTADTVHTTAVASREQWKVSTGSLATLLRHYHITFVTSLSQNIQLSLFAGNLRLRACLCPAPSGWCQCPPETPDTFSLSSSRLSLTSADCCMETCSNLQPGCSEVQGPAVRVQRPAALHTLDSSSCRGLPRSCRNLHEHRRCRRQECNSESVATAGYSDIHGLALKIFCIWLELFYL